MGLLRFFGALAVGGLVVLGAASAADAAPARPEQAATTTTVNNGSAPAFSEFAAAERKKQETSTRMIMMAGVLFVLAAVAPFAVMKLIPFAEGIDALEGGARFLSSRAMAGTTLASTGLNITSSFRGIGGMGGIMGGGLGGGGTRPGGGPTRGGPAGGPTGGPGPSSSGTGGTDALGGPIGGGTPGAAGDATGGPGDDSGGGGDGGGFGAGRRPESPGARFLKYGAAFMAGGPIGVAALAGARRVREKRSFQPRRGAPPPAGTP